MKFNVYTYFLFIFVTRNVGERKQFSCIMIQ